MSNLNKLSLIGLFLLMMFSLNAQEACKVMVPELVGTYDGKCKKGVAHGKGKAVGTDTYEGNFRKGLPNGGGVYTWASGASYDGDWVYGLREGEGIYKFEYDGHDSVQDGIWDGDEYKGKRFKKPYVVYKEFITKYRFRKSGDGNRILIDLWLNGQINRDILDFSLISNSGTRFELGRSFGIETITFPVTVKIKYVSWNTTHSSRHDAIFEFVIYEPGNWQVSITN